MGRLGSENVKEIRSGACSIRMLGFCTTVVEVGLESCAVGWTAAPSRENWGDR